MKILFISGSLGLGHIIRDIEIAKEMRKQIPDLEIDWIAAEPADIKLMESGENVHLASNEYSNENRVAESVSNGNRLNLARYVYSSWSGWRKNIELVKTITTETEYDLIIGDETYELFTGFNANPESKRTPFVMIFDFVGMDPVSGSLFERLTCFMFNLAWSRDYFKTNIDLSLFIGEPMDVPDKPFGFMLPNRRKYAKKRMKFVGYVVPFNPEEHRDKTSAKNKHGYSQEPLILCTVGGTTIGRELIKLCGEAYGYLKEKKPGIQMTVVTGPSIDGDSLDLDPEIKVLGYVPNLYEYIAASDVVVTQGGGGTTAEIAALNTPFIYFPIEGHFEQAVHVAGRLMRHGVGEKMTYSKTSPAELAEKTYSLLGNTPRCTLPVDGATNAAKHIIDVLTK